MYDSSFEANDFAQIYIELNPDGSITHYSGWHDQGQGADGGALGSCAHEALRPLGITPDKIRLVMNDTAITPFTGAAAGSRSHYMAGKATIDAAEQLINAMRKPDGTVSVHTKKWLRKIYRQRYTGHASPSGYSSQCDLNTMQGDPNPTYTYGVFMAEVEVDTKTGKTRVLKMVRCTAIMVLLVQSWL